MAAQRNRSVRVTLTLLLSTILIGLIIRFAPLGLPPSIVKYGGSTLWAMMIYWIVTALLRGWRPIYSALLSGVITTAVECFKLYHSPWLDAFRLTLPGILLLGRFFSMLDIVAYWSAIVVASVIDACIRRSCR